MAAVYLATIFGDAMKNKPAPEEKPSKTLPEIVITESGDLTVQVFHQTDNSDRYISATGYNVAGKLLAIFKVSRQVLMGSSAHFQAMLDPHGNFTEAKQKTVDLENENPNAVEIWFRYFHKNVDESYQIPINEIRAVIECHRRYLFPLEKLNAWFGEYMKRNGGEKFDKFSIEELRQLLFPCQEFDHAEGFAYATKKLVYETPGHIHEDLPSSFSHLHLEPRIISKSY